MLVAKSGIPSTANCKRVHSRVPQRTYCSSGVGWSYFPLVDDVRVRAPTNQKWFVAQSARARKFLPPIVPCELLVRQTANKIWRFLFNQGEKDEKKRKGSGFKDRQENKTGRRVRKLLRRTRCGSSSSQGCDGVSLVGGFVL